MRWEIVLKKEGQKRLPHDSNRSALKRIAGVASRNKTLGFRGILGKLHEPTEIMDEKGERVYRYLVRLRLQKENARDPQAATRQYEHVLKMVARKAKSEKWEIVEGSKTAQLSTGQCGADAEPEPVERVDTPFVVPELTEQAISTFFGDVYDREPHIRSIHDSVLNYADTLAKHQANPDIEVSRGHLLLKGKPAGCKTGLFERFKKFYEHDTKEERVTFVDMQSTSKAGLENWLLDRAEEGLLAPIVVLEEIEKVKPLDNLLPLVSLMGSGYAAKLNAKVGHRKALANILIWATCNNEDVIRDWNGQVLWSRFAHRLHCVRPTREQMHRILLDRIEQIDGDPAWATAAMTFAFDTWTNLTGHPMDDPREIKGLLDGRDRLLNGTYQEDQITIYKAEMREKGMC